MKSPVLVNGHTAVYQTANNAITELDADDGTDYIVSLTYNPSTLYALWNEYKLGTGKMKAAKDFTRKERGRCKYTYHQRKIVWGMV